MRRGTGDCRPTNVSSSLLRSVRSTMFEHRNRQLDIAALGLLAVTLFLGVSLVTYHHSDPYTLVGETASMVYPVSQSPQNACGRLGAVVAHQLLEKLGVGAFYLLGSLAVLTTLLAVQRPINQPTLRLGGWVLSLVGLCTLASLLLPDWSPGPIIGAGGYVGALGRAWLEANFARAGSLIFALSVLSAGLLLCTDYLVLQLAATMGLASTRGLASIGRATTSSLRPKTDVEDGIDLGDDEDGIDLGDDEEEYEDDEGEYEYEEDGEEWQEDYEDDEEPADAELLVRTPNDNKIDALNREEEKAASTASKSTLSRVARKLTSAFSGESNDEPSVESEPPAEIVPEEEPDEEPAPRFKKPRPKSEREEIIEQLEAADHDTDPLADYELPSIELLAPSEDVSYEEHEKEVRRKGQDSRTDLQELRLQRPRRGNRNRPRYRPIRGATRSRAAAIENHRTGRRPGDCAPRAQRPHCCADSR